MNFNNMNLKIVSLLLCVVLVIESGLRIRAAPINDERTQREKRNPILAAFTLSPSVITAGLTALKAGGKILIWTTIFTSSAVAGHVITKKIDENDDEKYLERMQLKCQSNNYGCAANYCWVSCGPRLNNNDWCVAAPLDDTNADKNNTVVVVTCKNDSDCDPCLKCAGTCMLGKAAYINADGSLIIHD